jgi:hypothetical protein
VSPDSERLILDELRAGRAEVREELAEQRQSLQQVRVEVARLAALGEAQAVACDLRHEAIDGRDDRHSDAIEELRRSDADVRALQVSQTEAELVQAKLDLTARRASIRPASADTEKVAVARWQAIAVLGAAALTGGVLAALARTVVGALAHAMGVGG